MASCRSKPLPRHRTRVTTRNRGRLDQQEEQRWGKKAQRKDRQRDQRPDPAGGLARTLRKSAGQEWVSRRAHHEKIDHHLRSLRKRMLGKKVTGKESYRNECSAWGFCLLWP